MSFYESIRNLWSAIRAVFREIIRLIFPGPTTPRVDSFVPGEGWPGTIVTIHGVRFAAARDDNLVTIGGDRALVLTASSTELRVMAGQGTVSGPIKVTTSGGDSTSTSPFTVLPWPAQDNIAVPGAPVFFHGPQSGTPALGVADQPVLVVLAYPTDHDPGTAAQRTAKRNAEMATFADARRFWIEATYGATSWAYTFTDWLPLPRNRDFYFWQQDDIDVARRAAAGVDYVLHQAAIPSVPRSVQDPVTSNRANIDASLDAVEEILGAILEISRLDTGALKPEITVFPMADILQQLEVEFAPIARDKGLDLRVLGSSLAVRSDRRLLRRLLQNLVSNAVKYTETGRVLVGCRRRGDRVRIEIDGIGVLENPVE